MEQKQKTESGAISRKNSDRVIDRLTDIGGLIESGFVIDESNREYYLTLALYFANSEDSGIDNSKGLLITGNVGTGKTLSMGVMQRAFGGFKILNTRYVIREYLIDGIVVANRYGKDSFLQTPQGVSDIKKPITYCFDDLGLEETNSKLYGNQSNVIMEILLDRYDMFKRYGLKTYATTNLTPDLIEQYYGSRVRDRMREMMNYITLTGESKRK